jgi:hypothetical protein
VWCVVRGADGTWRKRRRFFGGKISKECPPIIQKRGRDRILCDLLVVKLVKHKAMPLGEFAKEKMESVGERVFLSF